MNQSIKARYEKSFSETVDVRCRQRFGPSARTLLVYFPAFLVLSFSPPFEFPIVSLAWTMEPLMNRAARDSRAATSPYNPTRSVQKSSDSRFFPRFLLSKTTGAFSKISSVESSTDVDDGSEALVLAPELLRTVTFVNIPQDQEPDVLCDFLLEVGAVSTVLTDADRGTESEEPLFAEIPVGADLAAFSSSLLQWDSPTWKRCNVTAFIPASIDVPALLETIVSTFPGQYLSLKSGYRVAQVPNKDWIVHVQEGWKPIVVANKFVLRFPWHTATDVEDALQSISVDTSTLVELKLQGGVAFGTGEHPTTQLCLEWLDAVTIELLQQHPDSSIKVLDYGAGSGILGMAACGLAQRHISPTGVPRLESIGIDIDIDAVRIANVNALNNNVSMRSYLPPLYEDMDSESKSLLLKAYEYAQARNELESQVSSMGSNEFILPAKYNCPVFDVCVANILAAPLISLSSNLYHMARPGAMIGMSGILSSQVESVVDAYRAAGWTNVESPRQLNGWALVTARRPP
jgi:ribosomal protein L11 methyltransferase